MENHVSLGRHAGFDPHTQNLSQRCEVVFGWIDFIHEIVFNSISFD